MPIYFQNYPTKQNFLAEILNFTNTPSKHLKDRSGLSVFPLVSDVSNTFSVTVSC